MNTALYTRVSTQEQAEHGYSIQEQEERLRAYCQAMNYLPTKVYADAGFSGSTTNRPALQLLIKDITDGKINRVVVYKLDRLSRSQKDTLYLIEDIFLKHKIDFISISESFDTSTPLGKAMIGILSVFAQLEREQIRERMQMGKSAKAKKGKISIGAHSLIGYDYIDGQYIINEYESIQVKKIFELYLSGYGTHAILEYLTQSGYQTKYGKWKYGTIRALIKNRTYTGMVRYRDEWYEGLHEAIIDEDTFQKAQAIKADMAEKFASNKRTGKYTTILSGILVCGSCGCPYSKRVSVDTRNGIKHIYSYYDCSSKRSMGVRAKCTSKRWSMEKLDSIILSEISKLATDDKYISSIKKTNRDQEYTLTPIKTEIDKTDKQIRRLLDLYSLSDMQTDILQEKISALYARKNELEQQCNHIKDQKARKRANIETVLSSFSSIIETGDIIKIRSLVASLISEIILDGDDIEIHWSFI